MVSPSTPCSSQRGPFQRWSPSTGLLSLRAKVLKITSQRGGGWLVGSVCQAAGSWFHLTFHEFETGIGAQPTWDSLCFSPAHACFYFSKQVNKLKRKRDHLTGYGPVSSLTSPSYPRSVVCPAQATLASPGSSEDTKHDPVLKKASDLALSSPGIPFPRDHMVGGPTDHRSLPQCHPDTSLSEKEAFL